MLESFVMKKEQCYDSHTDAGISKIEDGAEEDEMLSAPDWQPRWPIPFHEGEIEHIHYPALHQTVIACPPRHEFCYHGSRRIVEDHAVEEAVDNVSCRSCQDEREADDESDGFTPTTDDTHEIPQQDRHSYDAETGEQLLVHQFHAKRHATVLCEQDIEPVGHMYALVEIHARLDSYLDDLVNHQRPYDDESGGDCLVFLTDHLPIYEYRQLNDACRACA